MWRQESGFLEMFLTYYSQFEDKLTEKKTYRDFLFDILSLHEDSLKSRPAVDPQEPELDRVHSLTLTLPTEDPSSPAVKAGDPLNDPCWTFDLLEELPRSTSGETSRDLRTVSDICEEQKFDELWSERVNSKSNDDADCFESKLPNCPNTKGLNNNDNLVEQRLYVASCSIATQCSISNECFQNASVPQAFPNQCQEERSLLSERRLTNTNEALVQNVVSLCRKELPYVCWICNEKFICGRDFVTHRRIHTEVRLLTCSSCNKGFKNEYSLKKHVRVHSDARPFACTQCQRTFKQESALKTHERIHTDDRPYGCKLCERKFRYLSSLRAHDKTHSGERPYVCPLCQRTFKFSSSLSAHVSSHSNERPFACKMCNRRYTQRGSLYRHQAFPCSKPLDK